MDELGAGRRKKVVYLGTGRKTKEGGRVTGGRQKEVYLGKWKEAGGIWGVLKEAGGVYGGT